MGSRRTVSLGLGVSNKYNQLRPISYVIIFELERHTRGFPMVMAVNRVEIVGKRREGGKEEAKLKKLGRKVSAIDLLGDEK